MDTVDTDTFASATILPLTGLALSEAALCSTPIVASDLDRQSNLMTTRKTVSLLRFQGWQEIADNVEEYLCNPELAATWEKMLEHGPL